jgi:hypothetical protein
MKSTARRTIPRYVLVVTALMALGCDPGYRFKPVAWIEQSDAEWSRDFDGFSMRTRYLHGLVGESWLDPTFEVFGNSQRVTLTAASLQTAGGRYAGVIESRSASVSSGGGTLSVQWDFGRDNPTPKVLGDHAQIVLDLLVGSRPQRVVIEYAQTSCCL